MKKLVIATFAFLPFYTLADTVDSGVYINLGYDQWSDSEDDEDLSLSTISAIAGYDFNEYIALEARYGFASSSDSLSYQHSESYGELNITGYAKADIELEKYASVYIKPKLPIGDIFNIYALLGYSYTDVGVNVDININASDPYGYSRNLSESYSESSTENGFSYGLGASVTFAEHFSIATEWKSLIEEDDLDFKGFSLIAGYKF